MMHQPSIPPFLLDITEDPDEAPAQRPAASPGAAVPVAQPLVRVEKQESPARVEKHLAPERAGHFMGLALEEARVASLRGEVPVGCVLVDDGGEVVARGHNLRELLKDPTAHAEMIAMRQASLARASWRLDGLTAYVTLEPCPMCAGAFINARIARVVYGCDDPKAGALRSLYRLGEDDRFNHRFQVVPGVRADECADALRSFFKGLRGDTRRNR